MEVTDGPCKAVNTVQLIRAPLPVGSMPETVIICDDPENVDPETDNYDLNPGTFAGYEWFLRRTPDSPETSLNYTDQIYTVEKKGIYRVEITNTWGCKSDVITDVLNDCVPKIYAPTAFRPASSVPGQHDLLCQDFLHYR